MREAVGGSLLLYIVIPIIILFIIFIGFIMSYASAYRAANYIVTQVENCQARMDDCAGVTFDSIKQTIKEKYSYVVLKGQNDVVKPCYIKNGSSYVFRVSLPVSFDLPMFGTSTIMNVKVETKSIPSVPSKSLKTFSGECK